MWRRRVGYGSMVLCVLCENDNLIKHRMRNVTWIALIDAVVVRSIFVKCLPSTFWLIVFTHRISLSSSSGMRTPFHGQKRNPFY